MATPSMDYLGSILFEQLERLNDDEWMAEHGDEELRRSKALTNCAAEVNTLYKNALDSVRLQDELVGDVRTMPSVITGRRLKGGQ